MGPAQVEQTRPTPEQFYTRRPQVKREYMRGPNEREISWEAQFSLPASNPVLDVMSHGMEAGSVGDVVKRTGVIQDVRGEPTAVRSLKEVELPNFLINDRQNMGAIERSQARSFSTESDLYGY